MNILDKTFGILLYLLHWSILAICSYLVIFSNDLMTLLIINLFICVIIQFCLLFGNCCILNSVENIYVKEEKSNFEKIVNYDKIVHNNKSLHHLLFFACISIIKTCFILIDRNMKS